MDEQTLWRAFGSEPPARLTLDAESRRAHRALWAAGGLGELAACPGGCGALMLGRLWCRRCLEGARRKPPDPVVRRLVGGKR